MTNKKPTKLSKCCGAKLDNFYCMDMWQGYSCTKCGKTPCDITFTDQPEEGDCGITNMKEIMEEAAIYANKEQKELVDSVFKNEEPTKEEVQKEEKGEDDKHNEQEEEFEQMKKLTPKEPEWKEELRHMIYMHCKNCSFTELDIEQFISTLLQSRDREWREKIEVALKSTDNVLGDETMTNKFIHLQSHCRSLLKPTK